MKRRFPKLPIRSMAYLAGGLILGATLAPAAAQSLKPTDGQVVVRSDGAVYLIANNMRLWVATVRISDDELNAYPEAEPVFTALAPLGGPASTGSAAPPAAAAPASGAAPTATTVAAAAAPAAPTPTLNPNELPIEVDISGSTKIEAGERLIVQVKSTVGASCTMVAVWPGGATADQGTKTADSRGICRYSFEIPQSTAPGAGLLKATVKDGAKSNQGDAEFEVLPTT